eukprot:557285-Pleurochrysis_carterae.AAC.1
MKAVKLGQKTRMYARLQPRPMLRHTHHHGAVAPAPRVYSTTHRCCHCSWVFAQTSLRSNLRCPSIHAFPFPHMRKP